MKTEENRKWKFLVIYATVTMMLLMRAAPFAGLGLKLCWLCSQVFLYWGLSDRVSFPSGTNTGNFSEALHTLAKLSEFIAFITVLLVLLRWPDVLTGEVVMVGILKALRWTAAVFLVCCSGLQWYIKSC